MIENLPLALNSLQSALELGRAMIGVRDATNAQDQLIKFNEAIISAQQKIISAQREHQGLVSELERAKAECTDLQRWDNERQKYSCQEIARGVFAYVIADQSGELMNAHKYCCNCFDQYRKSTLQQFDVETGRKLGLRCPNGCPDVVFYCYSDMT